MNHISFGYTSEPLLAGAKTVTRRDWKESHATKFHKGDLVAAYNKSPRAGGKQIATIRLTADPVFEHMSLMLDGEYEAEGFEELDYLSHERIEPDVGVGLAKTLGLKYDHGHDHLYPYKALFQAWKKQDRSMWVIRFVVVEVLN